MNKVEYILNELPVSVVAIYDLIKVNPGIGLEAIKDSSGYSIITIRRFIRTLKSAELIIIDFTGNHYYVSTQQ